MRQAVADGVGRGYGDPRPGHRVPLGEDWALWRLAAVRSAGLPVSGTAGASAATAGAAVEAGSADGWISTAPTGS